MKTFALAVVLATTVSARAADSNPAALAGHWTGVLSAGGKALRMLFQFSASSTNELSGTMDCAQIGVHGAAVTGAVSDWPRATFAVPVREAIFDGAFDATTERLSGSWKEAGRELPLVLRRAEAPQRWEGVLAPAVINLSVVLHLGREVGGDWFGALDVPEQGATGVAASSVTWSNADVRVSFDLMKARFEGQLNAASNQLAGYWQQSGEALPVTFVLTNHPPKKLASRSTRPAHAPTIGASTTTGTNWPSYHGPRGSGLAEGFATPEKWDVATGQNVRWKTAVPGLGLSSPVIWGTRVFLTTAVAAAGEQKLKIGLYGDIGAAEDNGEQEWRVLCLDKDTGQLLWEKTAHAGRPKIKRHTKATHANATMATDGRHVVAHFGSEGLYCYDQDGVLLWKKDFGVLDSGYYAVPSAQWGYGNSPVIHDGRLIVQCDVQTNSFVASYDLRDGHELWRTPRAEVPTWCTPTIVEANGHPQIICNGYHVHAGYDFATGRELWRFRNGGDIPVPTPVVGHNLAFLTSAHGRLSPIYAVRLSAEGDITLGADASTNAHIAWSVPRGGSYLQTPVLVGDELYLCNDLGILSCYDARTGQRHYQERLSSGGNGFTASPVAADGKIYCAAENGRVYVAALGQDFELLAKNELGEPCLVTPAIAAGTIYFRTQGHVIAIGPR